MSGYRLPDGFDRQAVEVIDRAGSMWTVRVRLHDQYYADVDISPNALIAPDLPAEPEPGTYLIRAANREIVAHGTERGWATRGDIVPVPWIEFAALWLATRGGTMHRITLDDNPISITTHSGQNQPMVDALLAAGFTPNDARTSLLAIRRRLGIRDDEPITVDRIRAALDAEPEEPIAAIFGTDAGRAITVLIGGHRG